MSGPVLGVDLGTTNSVVAVADAEDVRVLPDDDGNPLIPSVVSVHPAGDVLVGHAARERRLLDARNTIYSVKRLIGRPYQSPEVRRAKERFAFELCEGPTEGVLVRARGETYTLPEISAFVLREVRRVAEARLGQPCTRAVITVPANFNELQRSATKAAGRVAGLEVLRILNEPTAAALAYGYGQGSRERVAVFDLGGGTFDLTILELAGDVFEVVATAVDTFLGGDDFDLLLAEKMADAFLAHHRFDARTDPQAFERLRAAAEWAKCQLSFEEEVQLRVEELAYGDAGASLDLSFALKRSALEQMIQPIVARSFDVCEDAMKIAGIRPSQLDNVILVGGSTRIPIVRRMVAEYFQREPLSHIDPDLVVARGAALQGVALSGEPAAKLARVKLKRVTLTDLASPAEARRQELASEIEAERPAQPAFAPARVVPDWDDVDEVPTSARASPLDAEPTRVAPAGQEATRIAPALREPEPAPHEPVPHEPTRISSVPAVLAEQAEQRTHVGKPPPPLERWADVEVKPAVSVGAAPPAAAPPPPPPKRRAPPKPPGGSTLGFGTEGLPAVREPAAPPPALPPAPPASPVAPVVPARPTPIAAPTPPPPAPMRPPLLLDVTPLTLGVETVGGFCEAVIPRNAAIPVEQTRVFSTGTDGQESVSVRIVQGESRKLDENQALGHLELVGLRSAPRGEVKIGVTFVIDADGTLGVRAKDLETGREQTTRIALLGGVSEGEIARMAERQDRARR
ncbi:MAG: Hsp70 family protein [Sandaracinaceae bacterium]|nr:Hsp70 family protein [Sandaracinaceae bacterium]